MSLSKFQDSSDDHLCELSCRVLGHSPKSITGSLRHQTFGISNALRAGQSNCILHPQNTFSFRFAEDGGQEWIILWLRPKALRMRLASLGIWYALRAGQSNCVLHPQNTFSFRFAEDGGQEWIRTTEGDASGFTVRPVWPLRYLPIVSPIPDGASVEECNLFSKSSIRKCRQRFS